jgi:ApbE superfamily uncharacterized protein (UPF0280 family)
MEPSRRREIHMQRHHYEYKDTIVTILCDAPFAEEGMRSLTRSRDDLEAYIRRHPEFKTTHEPYPVPDDGPEIAALMARETAKAGVGPMAAVAGAFAGAAAGAMLRAGAREAVVDNGGDIAFRIQHPMRVGIYAGASPIQDLAFELEPREGIFGLCTSSGTVGPSFSYGRADAAVVLSGNVALADAAATALGNRVSEESDLETCFDFMAAIPEIEGALVIFRDRTALWGSLPRLVRSKVDWGLITKGEK